MNNQGMNGYLKNSEILTILPAPADTRAETSIVWYEVQVYPAERRTLVNANDINGDTITTMEVKQSSVNEATITIEEQNVVKLTERLAITKDGTGNTRIQVRAYDDDDEIIITSENSDPSTARASGQRRLVDGEQPLPKHWERLIDPLITLARALKVRAIDSHSWGCTSCCVLLGGVAVGAFGCVKSGGNPAACAGAITGGALFLENCEGACA